MWAWNPNLKLKLQVKWLKKGHTAWKMENELEAVEVSEKLLFVLIWRNSLFMTKKKKKKKTNITMLGV